MKKIINKLKHIFVPHHHNDYRPHFFREVSIFVMIVTFVVVLAISVGSRIYIRNTSMLAEVLPSILVDLTNSARLSSGTGALSRNPILDQAAQMKANDMASYSYFAHTSPLGVTPWHWFSRAGYTFVYAGENLAINFLESLDVNNAWLNSPTHKANILNDKFTEIGIATKEGYYNGRPTIYVVQMFGKPAIAPRIEVALLESELENRQIPDPIQKIEEPKKLALDSSVKGETLNIEDNIENNLEMIIETEEFISVKNNSVEDIDLITNIERENYSKWYQKFLFKMPAYADSFYKIFLWIILFALIIMTIVEIRMQRPKNIMYGIFIIVIIFTFLYINRQIFIIEFLLN